MTKDNRKKTYGITAVAALLLTALLCYRIEVSLGGGASSLAIALLSALRLVIYISLLCGWCMSLARRIVNRKVKRLLLSVGGLMIIWLLFNGGKGILSTAESPVGRFVLCCFYALPVFIQLLCVFAAFFFGKHHAYVLPKAVYLLLLPAVALLLGVFAKAFYDAMPYAVEEWINKALMLWFILISLCFAVTLAVKSQLPEKRPLYALPIIISAVFLVLWAVYYTAKLEWDVAAINCIITVLLFESAVYNGLIHENSYYAEMLGATTMAIQIVDNDYAPHYASANGGNVTVEEMRSAEEADLQLGDTILRSAKITAGHVLWQDDISKLNQLMLRLEDNQEQLGEENTLLQAELELKIKRAKNDEKDRLYDRIVGEVATQLEAIDNLLSQREKEPESADAIMAKVCVIGSYIKRRGNLMLLGEDNRYIKAKELEYCIRESLDNLRLSRVSTALDSFCEGKVLTAQLIAIYDVFEALVERQLNSLSAMLIQLSVENDKIKVNIQMGCREEIPEDFLDGISFNCGEMKYNVQENDAIINLSANTGGDDNA